MRLRIFPPRTSEERKLETRSAMTVCGVFAAISAAGIGGFLVLPAILSAILPNGSGWWEQIRWLLLLAGVLSFFLTLQSLFELAVAATIGPERAFALVAVLVGLAAFCGWLMS